MSQQSCYAKLLSSVSRASSSLLLPKCRHVVCFMGIPSHSPSPWRRRRHCRRHQYLLHKQPIFTVSASHAFLCPVSSPEPLPTFAAAGKLAKLREAGPCLLLQPVSRLSPSRERTPESVVSTKVFVESFWPHLRNYSCFLVTSGWTD